MQTITIYIDAHDTLGSVRDYANAKDANVPSLTRDVEVLLRLRLFKEEDVDTPYPMSQLQQVTSWQFVMDRDFNSHTTPPIVADNENITLESTAHALGISISHLSHFFSQKIRINFRRFINSLRIDKARQLMRDPNMTLNTICALCGYTNIRTFRRAFLQETGTLPSDELRAQRVKAGKKEKQKPAQKTAKAKAEAKAQQA